MLAFERSMEDVSKLPPDVRDAMHLDIETATTQDFLDNAVLLEEALAATTRGTSKKFKLPKSRVGRPSIPPSDTLAFMKVQGASTKILWGEDDISEMRHKEILSLKEASTKPVNLYTDSQSSREDEDNIVPDGEESIPPPPVRLQDILQTISAAENPMEGLDPTEAKEAAEQNLIWAVRQAMSSTSAPMPTYLESCAATGVDPDDPVIATSTIDPKTGTQYRYKPHQIISKRPY